MSETTALPVVEGVLTETPDGHRLLGARCPRCTTVYFPQAETCSNPDCDAQRTEEALLGPRGQVWSFTVLHYPPPAPFSPFDPFRPYAVALVELPEGLRVAGIVRNEDTDALRVGQAAELVLQPVRTSPGGRDVVTWSFDVEAEGATR